MIVIVNAAKKFISDELISLWHEIYPSVMSWYAVHSYIIYYNSDLEWQVLGNAPRGKDILCVIDFKEKSVKYFVNGNKFDSEKDYVSALRNIAFL